MDEYERLKNRPAFKRFIKRQSTVPVLSWDEKFKQLKKRRQADIKAFMRPRGINSVLGAYTTGYGTSGYPEMLYLQRFGNDVISTAPDRSEVEAA